MDDNQIVEFIKENTMIREPLDKQIFEVYSLKILLKKFIDFEKQKAKRYEVYSIDDFENAVLHFKYYGPVYVVKELKDKFSQAISDYFIKENILSWEMTVSSLISGYRFRRN